MVTNGLYSNPALAMLAGIAIVIMAIALDRATAAIAERTDPARRQLTDEGRERARRITLATFGLIAVIVLVARALGVDVDLPGPVRDLHDGLQRDDPGPSSAWLQRVLDYIQDPTLVHLRHHRARSATSSLEQAARAAAQILLVETPVVHRARRRWRDRAIVLSGLRPAITAS